MSILTLLRLYVPHIRKGTKGLGVPPIPAPVLLIKKSPTSTTRTRGSGSLNVQGKLTGFPPLSHLHSSVQAWSKVCLQFSLRKVSVFCIKDTGFTHWQLSSGRHEDECQFCSRCRCGGTRATDGGNNKLSKNTDQTWMGHYSFISGRCSHHVTQHKLFAFHLRFDTGARSSERLVNLTFPGLLAGCTVSLHH